MFRQLVDSKPLLMLLHILTVRTFLHIDLNVLVIIVNCRMVTVRVRRVNHVHFINTLQPATSYSAARLVLVVIINFGVARRLVPAASRLGQTLWTDTKRIYLQTRNKVPMTKSGSSIKPSPAKEADNLSVLVEI
jgi:hypothetical protein